MNRALWATGSIALLLVRAAAALAHGPEMFLGSTARAAGGLALSYQFADKVIVSESVSIAGMTLYTSILPGFEWLQEDSASESLYALKVGTPFSIQIVSIRQGASVMVGGTTLSAVGQSAFVANTTNVAGDHFHPQWQLLLPTGVTGDYPVSFKLTTTSSSYTSSPNYTLIITNIPETTGTPTATPVPSGTPTTTAQITGTATPPIALATPTPTAPSASPSATTVRSPSPTPSPPSLLGDANCDDLLSAADLPADVELFGMRAPVRCGADADGDGVVGEADVVMIIDALFRVETR